MKKWIKKIDFFGTQMQFTYKRKEKIKTLLGGYLSIFCFILLITLALITGQDIFFQKNPDVVVITDKIKNFSDLNLKYNNNFFGYYISDSLLKPFNDESIIKFIPLLHMSHIDINGNLTPSPPPTHRHIMRCT